MAQNDNDKEFRFAFLSILAAIPILTQTVFDVLFIGPVVPMIVLFFSVTIVQLTGVSLFVGLLTDLKHKTISTNTVIAISSLSAWGLSLIYWVTDGTEAGAAFASIPAISIPLALISKILVRKSLSPRNRRKEFRDQILPNWAFPRKLGVEQERIPINQVTMGQLLQINTYSLAPTDGLITEGMAQFTGELITGDPLPRHRGPGDRVLAGEKCIGGSVVIQATKDGATSRLAEAMYYTEHAPDFNHRKQAAEKYLKPFTYVALGLLFPVFIFWGASSGGLAGLKAALGLLAIYGPVALGIYNILPLFIVSKKLLEKGVKIHRSDIGEASQNVKNFLVSPIDFLIMKRARLGEIVTEGEEEEAIALALGIIKKVGYPLESALELEAAKRSIDPIEFSNVYFEPGRGLVGVSEDRTILLGNPALLAQFGVGYRIKNQAAQEIENRGHMAIWLAEAEPSKSFLAILEFFPVVRNTLQEALNSLQSEKISSHLLAPYPEATYLRKLSDYFFDESIKVDNSAELSITVQNMQLRGEGVAVAPASPLDLAAAQVADVMIGYKEQPEVLTPYNSITLPSPDPHLATSTLIKCRKLGITTNRNAKFSFLVAGAGMALVTFGLASPLVAGVISLTGLGLVVINTIYLYLE